MAPKTSGQLNQILKMQWSAAEEATLRQISSQYCGRRDALVQDHQQQLRELDAERDSVLQTQRDEFLLKRIQGPSYLAQHVFLYTAVLNNTCMFCMEPPTVLTKPFKETAFAPKVWPLVVSFVDWCCDWLGSRVGQKIELDSKVNIVKYLSALRLVSEYKQQAAVLALTWIKSLPLDGRELVIPHSLHSNLPNNLQSTPLPNPNMAASEIWLPPSPQSVRQLVRNLDTIASRFKASILKGCNARSSAMHVKPLADTIIANYNSPTADWAKLVKVVLTATSAAKSLPDVLAIIKCTIVK